MEWAAPSAVPPKNSLLELTLDFMHCISESITTKSPSQPMLRAAVRRRLWKNAGGCGGGGAGGWGGWITGARRFGISELYVDALFRTLPVKFLKLSLLPMPMEI